jgi:AraC-like DNA-binding protein
MIYNFFQDFVKKYASNKESQTVTNKIVNSIKQYILENINEQITLDDIANIVGYNKEYIIRLFKKEFGLTPHAFLINEKVNYAKNLIDQSDKLNLSNIAINSGFYDQSHFTKFFKRSFAITPQKYKYSI